MTESHRRFGELLEEGLKRVHITRKKPIGYILDEFGYELRQDGSKGRYALGHWYYKKRIAADPADVEKLARLIVLNSDVDWDWLENFLESAGYPDPEKICKQYFLPSSENQPARTAAPPPEPPAAAPPAIVEAPLKEPSAAVSPLPEAQTPARQKTAWLALLVIGVLVIAGVIALSQRAWFYPAFAGTSEPARVTPTLAAVNQPSPTRLPIQVEATPLPPTLSPTPFPTLTFAASPLPSVSPSASPSPAPPTPVVLDGRCPTPTVVPTFVYAGAASFTQFFSAGGTLGQMQRDFEQQVVQYPFLAGGKIGSGDITGDKIAEIIVAIPTETGSLELALGCHAGAYQSLFDAADPGVYLLADIQDLNADGKAEVIRYQQTQSAQGHLSEYSIQAWDGRQFREMLDTQEYAKIGSIIPAEAGSWDPAILNATAAISDTNQDGLYELVVTGGLVTPRTCENIYQRQHSDVWIWDGKSFVLSERVYTDPVYRFQAAVDGDVAFAFRQYDRASLAYQKVIFDANLYPRKWLPPQLEYCGRLAGAEPVIDANIEGLQLEAYARWKNLLIQAVQNHPDAAQIMIQTLQQRFPAGTTGSAYAAIATAFWESYQNAPDGAAACALARDTAEKQQLYPGHTPAAMCNWP